jgi:hypothetical protein
METSAVVIAYACRRYAQIHAPWLGNKSSRPSELCDVGIFVRLTANTVPSIEAIQTLICLIRSPDSIWPEAAAYHVSTCFVLVRLSVKKYADHRLDTERLHNS